MAGLATKVNRNSPLSLPGGSESFPRFEKELALFLQRFIFDHCFEGSRTPRQAKSVTSLPFRASMIHESHPLPGNTPAQSPVQAKQASTERYIVWGIVAVALLLRLIWLGGKPAHFDEGVNGFFVDQMTREGMYRYNPGDYHGPFHFYVLFIAQTLLGRSEWALRLPLALAGAACVWVTLLYRRYLGWRVAGIAALALAISPGMTFYSRYAIHETWLVLGMLLAFWGVAGLWLETRRGSVQALFATVGGVTLMILNKETYLIHLIAFGLACGTLLLLERFVSPSGPLPSNRPATGTAWTSSLLIQSLGGAVLLLIFFYSGGFLAPEGLPGIFTTFSKWIATGTESASGHSKGFFYWLQLMGRYEWPALLGLFYSLRALLPGMNRLNRLIAIYGLGSLVAYSLVSYKTPWCIISILWPFFFLYGEGVKAVIGRFREQPGRLALVASLALAPLIASLGISISLNFYRPVDATEPYVYVQTLDDVRLLTEPLRQLAEKDPSSYGITGHILMESYHPLPWLLGRYPSVGYYGDDTTPSPTVDADFLIVSANRLPGLETQLRDAYFVESFQLRDGLAPGRLYLKASTFRPLFPGRAPEHPGHSTAPTQTPAPVPNTPLIPPTQSNDAQP